MLAYRAGAGRWCCSPGQCQETGRGLGLRVHVGCRWSSVQRMGWPLLWRNERAVVLQS